MIVQEFFLKSYENKWFMLPMYVWEFLPVVIFLGFKVTYDVVACAKLLIFLVNSVNLVCATTNPTPRASFSFIDVYVLHVMYIIVFPTRFFLGA